MTNSFVWQIVAMFHGIAIGITQLILARNSPASPHDENMTSLGFGQILSICTLFLPFIGFLEAGCGKFTLSVPQALAYKI